METYVTFAMTLTGRENCETSKAAGRTKRQVLAFERGMPRTWASGEQALVDESELNHSRRRADEKTSGSEDQAYIYQ